MVVRMTPPRPTGLRRVRRVVRRSGRLPAFLVGVALLVSNLRGPLRAGDDIVGEERDAGTQQQQFHRISLDQQMRGMLGDGSEPLADVVRRKVRKEADLEIERLDDTCGLSDAQRAKLGIAASLEAARLAARFERFQQRYAGRSLDLGTPEGQEEWQRFHQDLRLIHLGERSRAGSRSLLARSVGRVLDQRQRALVREESRRRRAFQWRLAFDSGLSQMDALVGMTGRQHDALLAMLVATDPRIDLAKARETFGDPSPIPCWYVMSGLDRAALEAIFSPRQWERVQTFVRQGEAWGPRFDMMRVAEE